MQRAPFHVMAKPIGPICNIDCEYCYYLEKESLYPKGENFKMTEPALESYIRQFIANSPGPRVDFAWQGGEPTLMGLDFFQRVVALQKKHLPAGWSCTNAIQTNGTLLNDDWCRFFKEESFLVGLSVDGPAHLHDFYRKDKGGKPTHERVMRGLRLLQQHGVDFNILCVVNQANAAHPLDVYRFFKSVGVNWIQFIPIVEREGEAGVTDRSVSAAAYGEFLAAIFDEWVRHDVGKVFVQIFEECFTVWAGLPATLCIFAETCGRAMAMEHNGDVYACDHFVEPGYHRGNLHLIPLSEIVDSPEQLQFGLDKRDTLPAYCRTCEVRFMCNGGCPKDRFITTPDGEPGLNYLCAGFKRFFTHVDPYLRRMVALWQRGMSPALIMDEVRRADEARWAGVQRNDRCPCGSGKKYKACCLPVREARQA
ncbi:MAG: anaerobic sulfatase maturase [Bacillota bacterium]